MMKTKWLAVVAAGFLAGAPIIEAEAKRLGGGGNIGRMAPSQGAKPGVPAKPAQPQSQPQTAPAGQQAATPAAANAGAVVSARLSARRWQSVQCQRAQRHGTCTAPCRGSHELLKGSSASAQSGKPRLPGAR